MYGEFCIGSLVYLFDWFHGVLIWTFLIHLVVVLDCCISVGKLVVLWRWRLLHWFAGSLSGSIYSCQWVCFFLSKCIQCPKLILLSSNLFSLKLYILCTLLSNSVSVRVIIYRVVGDRVGVLVFFTNISSSSVCIIYLSITIMDLVNICICLIFHIICIHLLLISFFWLSRLFHCKIFNSCYVIIFFMFFFFLFHFIFLVIVKIFVFIC